MLDRPRETPLLWKAAFYAWSYITAKDNNDGEERMTKSRDGCGL